MTLTTVSTTVLYCDNEKLISRWDRRTLPLEPRHRWTSNLPSSCLWNDVLASRVCIMHYAYACLQNMPQLSHSAIYSTFTNTALDVLWSSSAPVILKWLNLARNSLALNYLALCCPNALESTYYNPWLLTVLIMNGVTLLPCRKLI